MIAQKLTSNRRQLVAIIGLVAIAAVGGILFWRWSEATSASSLEERAWLTVDHGKTWFAESAAKLSPFEHEGKLAYRCYVFTCDGGKTKFVSHLERSPPELRKASGKNGPFDPMSVLVVEVKDPLTGNIGWTPRTDPKASEITAPRCPDDPGLMGEPVIP